DRPDMLEPTAELSEDRLRQRGIALLRAHEAEQLALSRRAGRAADRTLDEAATAGAHHFGKRDLHVRPNCAHLDEKPVVHVASKQAVLAVVDMIDRVRV